MSEWDGTTLPPGTIKISVDPPGRDGMVTAQFVGAPLDAERLRCDLVRQGIHPIVVFSKREGVERWTLGWAADYGA